MHLRARPTAHRLRRFLAVWLVLCLCGLCCVGTCLPFSVQATAPPAQTKDPHACCRARTANAAPVTPTAADDAPGPTAFTPQPAHHAPACCLSREQKTAPKRFVPPALRSLDWGQAAAFAPVTLVVSGAVLRHQPRPAFNRRHLYLQHCLLLI